MKIQEIIDWAEASGYQFEFVGDKDTEIDSFSSLNHYRNGSLTWIKKRVPDDVELLKNITCAVVQKGLNPAINNVIFSSNSKELFFSILSEFFSSPEDNEARQRGTYIGKDVEFDPSVQIGCNCVLDGDIQIGRGTIIEHNVVIMNRVRIGENCIIHSGTVIGKDGFGFAFDKDNLPVKAKHFGGVEIGDRVEIGANCTIDRGTIDNTVIHDDVKIDNLVLVAHNVEIGKGTLIIGCTDLAGSSRIGGKSYIGPQVCVKNQVSIGSNSFIGMGIMVNQSLGDDMMLIKNVTGQPAKNRNYRRFL